jgi:drug/metabolite transporter (DMT)-like permease
MALLANIIIFYFFAKATSVIDSGIAGAISGTIPLFTVMLSIFFLKDEKLSIYKVLGVITGLIGVLIITTPWQASSFKENLLGVTYMTIGSLFYAYSFIYARKFLIPKKISPSALTSYQAFFSLIITTLLVDLSTLFNVFNSTKAMLGSVFGLGLIGTGIAYIIYYKLVEGLGAIKASTVTYIPPVVAIIIGQTFGGESFSISALIGVTIILTGVYITKLSKT